MSSVQLQAFADFVSSATGIDPRVIEAQASAEGNPGDLPGYNNYLNILQSTAQSRGIPSTAGISSSAGALARFATLQEGAVATVDEFRALGLGSEGGKTVAQQIADIGSSGWGTNPASIQQDFEEGGAQNASFGANALTGTAQTATLTSQEKSLLGPEQLLPGNPGVNSGPGGVGSGTAGLVTGSAHRAGSAVQSAVQSAVSPIESELGSVGSSITSAFDFVVSYRFLEIVGGGVLVVVGVVLLGRQFVSSGGVGGAVAKVAR